MQIENGKYYRTRDGRKVGPMVADGSKFWMNGKNALTDPEWSDDGTNFYPFSEECDDLIAEWADERTGTLLELGVKVGDVVECLEWIGTSYSVGKEYTVGGKNEHGNPVHTDEAFGKFRIASRASDTPTIWSDMTPEEKGALLLHQHEGGDVHMLIGCDWFDFNGIFATNMAYRKKPEPVVETLALCYRNDSGNVKNRIGTIKRVDGVIDCDSVTMEVL